MWIYNDPAPGGSVCYRWHTSYSEIARLTCTSPAWITAIMKLVDLPVPEQDERLQGRPPLTPTCRHVADR